MSDLTSGTIAQDEMAEEGSSTALNLLMAVIIALVVIAIVSTWMPVLGRLTGDLWQSISGV